MSQQPKFKVGEVCIVKYEKNPEYDGEYTVIAVAFQSHCGQYQNYKGLRYPGYPNDNGNWFYDLGIKDGDGGLMLTNEFVMFKKHEPGEMSFDEVMRSLTNKSKA